MSQDRRKNGWIIISSSLQIVLSIVLLSVGIALGVCGFLYQSKLATIDELQFFINQKGIIKAQHLISGGTKLLKPEFLYLFLGGIVALVGIIILILAIVSLVIANKKKVVRNQFKLTLFAIILLAIVGCTATYFVFEMDNLPDNIKYVLYGIMGAFGFCALCLILGLLFGRSEKFMSNDNNKYAFDDSSLRNARAGANNNVRSVEAQTAQSYNPQQQSAGMPNQAQRQPVNNLQPRRPQTVANGQPTQRMPGNQPMRTVGATARPVQSVNMSNNMARPVRPNPAQAPQNARPNMPQSAQMRPTNQVRPNASAQPIRPNGNAPINQTRGTTPYCPKCGKRLSPQEKFCVVCGYKLNK